MKFKLLFSATLLWGIAASVVATLFASFPLFYLSIRLEDLSNLTELSKGRLMENYQVLMGYLLNPFQSQLALPDFVSSSSALKHFAEVKGLFWLTISVFFLLAYPTFHFLKTRLYRIFQRGFLIAAGFPWLLVAFVFLFGFDQFFILFHQILFRDDTWLFDPLKDPIINVLTDFFFAICFLCFFLIYQGLFVTLILKGRLETKRAQFKKTATVKK